MATGRLFEVDFQVCKVRGGGGAGVVHSYRLPIRKVQVYAANAAAVQAVLNADITLQAGEIVDVVHIKDATVGGDAITYS